MTYTCGCPEYEQRISALEAENAALKAELSKLETGWIDLQRSDAGQLAAARQSRARLVGLVRHLRAWFSATAPDSAFVKRITAERDQYIAKAMQWWQKAEDEKLSKEVAYEMWDTARAERDAARAWAAIWKQRAKAYRENFNHLDCEADALCQSCTEARAWAAAWRAPAHVWRREMLVPRTLTFHANLGMTSAERRARRARRAAEAAEAAEAMERR